MGRKSGAYAKSTAAGLPRYLYWRSENPLNQRQSKKLAGLMSSLNLHSMKRTGVTQPLSGRKFSMQPGYGSMRFPSTEKGRFA